MSRDNSLPPEQVKRVVSTEESPESSLVHGVVFCKNVVHRRMRSAIVQPRILLLAGSLEYERTNSTLSSLSTSLGQVRPAPRECFAEPPGAVKGIPGCQFRRGRPLTQLSRRPSEYRV